MTTPGLRTPEEWERSGETVVFVVCPNGHQIMGFVRAAHPRRPEGVWDALAPESPGRGPDLLAVVSPEGDPQSGPLPRLRLGPRNGLARGVPMAARDREHYDFRCGACGQVRGPRWNDEELGAVLDALARVGLTRLSQRDLADKRGLVRRLGVSLRGQT